MKIVLTGNTEGELKKLTWNDMDRCNQHKSFFCDGAISNHKSKMSHQHLCIDLIEANSRYEKLRLWFDKGKNLDFTRLTFSPNADCSKNAPPGDYDLSFQWRPESDVSLEIIPENEDDVLAMNEYLYDRFRGIVYDENDHLKFVENTLKKWVKNLKDDIRNRFLKTEITKKEYQELEVGSIWEVVDQQKMVSQISFRSIVEEELARIKRGISLVPVQKLIQDEYKMPDHAGYYKFDPNHFMHRIVANDIARVIHDLQYNSFFPDCTPPYFIKPIKHEVYLKLQDELNPQFINKLGLWSGDKIDCARLIVTLEHLDLFKSDVTQLEIRKYFGLRFYNDENGLKEQLKKSKRPKYSKSEVKKWEFYNVLTRLDLN